MAPLRRTPPKKPDPKLKGRTLLPVWGAGSAGRTGGTTSTADSTRDRIGCSWGFVALLRFHIGSTFESMLRLATFVMLLGVGLNLSCCSEKRSYGDTSFAKEKRGFEKELTPNQRKAAIKQLQTETAGGASKP
jgi:hypothetical protein